MNLEAQLGRLGRFLDQKTRQVRTVAGNVVDDLSLKAAKLYGQVEAEAELRSLTADDIIARVNAYQDSGIVHPLTCGVNSNHENLKPVKTAPDNRVVLVCPTCHYVQDQIPREVLLAYSMLEEVKQAMDEDDEDDEDDDGSRGPTDPLTVFP